MAAMIIYAASCTKNDPPVQPPYTPIDYSNVNLIDKPLDTIRKAIAGRWQIHYDSTYGFTGWVKVIHTDDFLSFLPNDTIKRVINGVVSVYDKATITRGLSNWGTHTDTVYTYNIPASMIGFTMDQIFNDTLKIEQAPRFFYLTRKP